MGLPRDGGVRLRDVATAAGVSIGTASNVFNRPALVSEEARERVLEAAARLGYRGPDQRGRVLRAGKVNAIGVATAEPLSSFFTDPWARALMAAIAEACERRGAGVSLVSAQNPERLAWNIGSALVDGFVLLCIEQGEALLEVTEARGLPFVPLALDADAPGVPGIGIDDRGGAQEAAAHLVALGHRRFAILAIDAADEAGPIDAGALRRARYATVRHRAEGYLSALAEGGIAPAEVAAWTTLSDRASVEAALRALFAGPEPPTAILAMSDRVAMAALDWLAARGIAVPGAVSVVGFDGVPEGERAHPPLTTVAQPYARMAERAVSAILDGDLPDRREVLPLTLVIRGSSGPAPAG